MIMSDKHCYVAAWPDRASLDMLRSLGVEKDNLHLTTFFDGYDQLKWLEPFPWREGTRLTATITHVIEWVVPSGKRLLIAGLGCESNWSWYINFWYRSHGGRENLPHKPHLTLAKNVPEGVAAHFQRLVGCKIVFDRHGYED